MTTFRWLAKCSPLAACLIALPALATDGYFPHGYGLKAAGMGGASTAMAQDAMGGATNPASMVFAGSRMDLGLAVFSPRRDATRAGAAMPSLNGSVTSDSNLFLIPEFGYNRLLNSRLSAGVTVYGNGGMNTDYPQGNFNCGRGPANILCGSGRLGVDLIQLIVAPTVSYKLNEHNSVGLSLLLGYQRFKADGLQAFAAMPNFSQTPASVSNVGHDGSTGIGVRVGYFGQLTDRINVGVAFSPRIRMSKFDKYKGLFAGDGSFDIPENYSAGVSFKPLPDWTVAFDYERINYAGVASIGNPSFPVAPMGASNGPGFGWRNVDVFKVGAVWQMNPRWAIRAGINRGRNPITPADVTFNIVAPGVITTHYSAGFTYALGSDSELTTALMIAPRQSVSGPSLMDAMYGPGVAGNETIRMRELSLGVGWSKRF